METQKITDSPQPQNKFYLYHSKNMFQSHSYEIGQFFSIGRDSSNSLNLEDPHISGQHARIERNSKGDLVIRDLGSKNGSFLNGNKVKEAHLSHGDQLQFGHTKFKLLHKKMENGFHILKSHSKSWQTQLNRIPLVAKSECPVLLLGPSGTGKDCLARKIHEYSSRKNGPFISVNCSALSESLIESELFGHTKGSFTGAHNDRLGAFDSAQGGTLFLDEIGDLPLSLQPKLLRALENFEIKPVGSDKIKKTNVRIIAATHSNLKKKVLCKEFREDLYFRLHTLQINTPSLSQRLEDFESLLYTFARELKVNFSFQAIQKLKKHSWPGNIRELKNVATKASVIFPGQQIQANQIHELIDLLHVPKSLSPEPSTGRDFLKKLEYKMIYDALIKHKGNQRKASLELDLPKSTLNDKIKRYQINLSEINKL